MLGAIIGDIVGSRFEFRNHLSKEFELFGTGCRVTDDSIMSLAIAAAIMAVPEAVASGATRQDYDRLSALTVQTMQKIGQSYPRCGFGGKFYHWVFATDPKPYFSFGNGAAMRVGPAGFVAKDIPHGRLLADAVTEVTHNHPEGIRGARATVDAIVLARQGASRTDIRHHIESNHYRLDFTIAGIRDTYPHNQTCQGTVPQAIECFLEAVSFEDAIRTAISLGGDSDTLAAITGSIAEAYYGIPPEIREVSLSYLDADLRAIFDDWEQFLVN